MGRLHWQRLTDKSYRCRQRRFGNAAVALGFTLSAWRHPHEARAWCWSVRAPKRWIFDDVGSGIAKTLREAKARCALVLAQETGDTQPLLYELITAWRDQDAAAVVLDLVEELTGRRGYPGEAA